MPRLSRLLLALVPTAALAQPTPPTSERPPPLAQIKDAKQLAEVLSQITQDPSIPVNDDNARPLAQALMTEGVKQLQAKSYDQALANFLEAYAKFPSPKILLNVASTLRDMGRLADAANTYQRYLLDPATGAERVGEVKELLIKLDEQLTILTVRVFPSGSDISIDGGPFIPVGTSLLTRVRPGIHLVRIKKVDAANEVSINGFEGENKEVPAQLVMDTSRPAVGTERPAPTKPPDVKDDTKDTKVEAPQQAWLAVGTQYGTEDASSNSRKVRSGYAGPEISAVVPRFEVSDSGDAIVHETPREPISSGVVSVLRIDGKGRGFAGGVGFAIAKDRLEGEVALLRSEEWGGYIGFRYRLLTGFFRPYAALGMPLFVFDADTFDMMGNVTGTEKRLSVGVRYAAGLELMINGHLSVQGDLGGEYFWFVKGLQHAGHVYDSSVFVPTLGVILRL
jgi:hypothetical protein